MATVIVSLVTPSYQPRRVNYSVIEFNIKNDDEFSDLFYVEDEYVIMPMMCTGHTEAGTDVNLEVTNFGWRCL